jgi:Transposase zinc-ribbon domain
VAVDVLEHDDLSFPRSLPEFQRLFPDDAACAAYLEKARWRDGFVCPHCEAAGVPFRFANRPGDLRCRKCRCDIGLTAGTVMERTHTPLSVWFWAAYLVASQTSGISATQFPAPDRAFTTPQRRPMPSFTQASGHTLDVVGVGENRIVTVS